jgi:uncharacterized membrane protein YecN with MAPEG domain
MNVSLPCGHEQKYFPFTMTTKVSMFIPFKRSIICSYITVCCFHLVFICFCATKERAETPVFIGFYAKSQSKSTVRITPDTMQYVYLFIQIVSQNCHIIKKLIHALGAGLVRVAPTVETTFLQY